MQNFSPPALIVRGLTKTFRTSSRGRRKLFTPLIPRVVFRDLDLTVEAGEKVLLVGPNGSGKTTLLKLIAGLLPFEKGSIEFRGGTEEAFSRRHIGLFLTFEGLYSALSGWENLEFTARLHRLPNIKEAIDAAARQWRFEPHLHSPVSSYSLGLKARLTAARASLHKPRLLIMDEPTTGLDTEGNALLIEYLSKTSATVIIATHQPEVFQTLPTRSVSISQLSERRETF